MASFTNVATLSYGGNQVSSNVVTGEIREVLTVSKTAVPAAYAVGDTITYVIYLINSGTAALTGLTVTDDLGGYAFGAGTVYPLRYTDGTVRYFANGVLQAAPDVTAGPPLRFTGITVPGGRHRRARLSGRGHGLRAAHGGRGHQQYRDRLRRRAGGADRHGGDHGQPGRAARDHQGALARGRRRKRTADLHLHHPQLRPDGGGCRG